MTAAHIKSIVKERGAEILEFAVAKAKPDMSFLNAKSIHVTDVSRLKPEQRVAYYMELQGASSLNKFMDAQWGDNLYAKNLGDGRIAPQPRKPGDPDPATVVQKDIDGKLRKLERIMTTGGDMGKLISGTIGDFLKEKVPQTYSEVQQVFERNLFALNAADKYTSQSLVDGMSGLATTATLAQQFIAKDDFEMKMPNVSRTYNNVLSAQLAKSASGLGDTSWSKRGDAGPPPTDPVAYKKWFNDLTESSGSKTAQPLIVETFDRSDIAKNLKAAGITEESDTWNQYKETFAQTVTMQYNNYWSTIRKGVKLDVVHSQIPDDGRFRTMWTKLPVVAGVDAAAFRAGAFHTVQNATLSAALAGSLIAADGNASDPKTAMTVTYAVTNLADMVLETASKYLDPKGGGFQRLGSNREGEWTKSIAKYLPGGDFKKVEAAGKMLAGAGTVVFGAVAIWKTIDAIRAGDAMGTIFNGLNAAGSTVSGVALGAEGVLQWTNIAKNIAQTRFGMNAAGAAALDAAARGVLASVGYAAGLVAGLGLTALGIYEMAKGVKVLDKSQKSANERYIAPTTGWEYEFLIGPKA